MTVHIDDIALEGADGHRWQLVGYGPAAPRAVLLWLPAMGVAARHYLPLAEALAGYGIATFLHEWRGHGSSSVRAARGINWGYRELLEQDIRRSEDAAFAAYPDLPRIIGGHSLGGQLACCRLALAPHHAQRLWLVAASAPFPELFSGGVGLGLPIALRLTPWLSGLFGYWPGRRLGFGGREARGVMRDWAGTGRARGYRIESLGRDLDPLLADVAIPVDAIALAKDGFAPEAAVRALVGKLGGDREIEVMDDAALGSRSDHFSWLKQPDAIAGHLASRLGPAPPRPA